MKQKPKDLIVVLIIYLIALAAAVLTLKYAPVTDMLWKTALADVVATVVVFIFSVIYKNSSVYDPYWSAAPVFIVFYWLYQSDSVEFIFKIIWVLIIIWGVRLTWNWILRWDGMDDEDWRYVDIKKKTGKFYWPASFFGIHLMPTIWVFLGLVPVYYALQADVSPFDSWLATIAFLFTISAIYLEKTADDELRRFVKSGKSKTERIQAGLWVAFKYPNYIGEMSFWWGLFLFALAVDRSLWWTVFGPGSITLLFFFISMPMMNKHLANKIYK
jgi:steroid 5-alpha reductase family enzyme